MNDEEPFLNAIFQNPDDYDQRLVYADWLEEQGDVRADYVRYWLEYVQLPEDNPERDELVNRCRAILESLEGDWTPHLGIPMRWEEEMRRSLAETAAWCRSRSTPDDPEHSLRTQEFNVPALYSRRVETPFGTFKFADRNLNMNHVVRSLVNTRVRLLAKHNIAVTLKNLHDGKLLVCDPHVPTTSKSVAEVSRHFFDEYDTPPWDTWVAYSGRPMSAEERSEEANFEWFDRALLCWIPQEFVDLVDDAIHFSHQQINWVDAVDTAFTKRVNACLFD